MPGLKHCVNNTRGNFSSTVHGLALWVEYHYSHFSGKGANQTASTEGQMPSADSGITFLRSWPDSQGLENPWWCIDSGVGVLLPSQPRRNTPVRPPSQSLRPQAEGGLPYPGPRRCKRNTGGSYIWFWKVRRFSFKYVGLKGSRQSLLWRISRELHFSSS